MTYYIKRQRSSVTLKKLLLDKKKFRKEERRDV